MTGFARSFAVFLLLLACLSGSAASCKRKGIEGDRHAEVKDLFDSMCGKCHGSDGRGGVPAMQGQAAPRNFCDAAFQASRTDDELKKVIRAGKGPMPPFGAVLDDSQLTLLAAYIRGFNPRK